MYCIAMQVESLHEEANLLDVELSSLRRVITDAGDNSRPRSSNSSSVLSNTCTPAAAQHGFQ
jgi:hypothetical protein